MTDKQWYDLTKAEYEKVAAGLLADGYSRNERTDIYKEDFTKTGQTLVIVRHLGSPNWWTKEL